MRLTTICRVSSSLGMFMLVAACASQTTTAPPTARVNLSGFSPGFKQGYDDGCVSSGTRNGARRDEGRYKTEAEYMMGWNDGYSACRRR